MKIKSLGKIIAIVGGIVTVVVLLGFAALWIMFPPEKIKALVTTQVGKIIGRPVKIGKAGISVYPFIGISLSDIEIANTKRPGYSKDAFLSFNRFLLQISVLSLIKKQPEIKKIVLKKPLIRLEVDSSGAFNFEDLAIIKKDTVKVKSEKKQGMPVLPVPVSLQSFVIENGRFIYHDAKSKQYLTVDDIDDVIAFSIDKELKNITTVGDLSLAQVSLRTEELTKPLSNLVVTLHHDIGADLQAGNAHIKALRLSLQKVFLNLTGTVTDLQTTPKLDCSLSSDAILLQELLKEIPVELAPVLGKISAAGELLVGLELKGTLAKDTPLPIKGRLSIKNGAFQYAELPKSVNQIQMQCAFTENSLDVASLKMHFGDNPVALKVKVDNFKKPLIDLKLLANIKLDEVKDFAKLPVGSLLSGQLNAEVNAKGFADPSDPSKITIQGKLDLNNATVLWPPLVKPAIINGGIAISSQAIGNSLSLSIGRSQLTLNANVKNYLSFVFPDSTKKLPRPDAAFTITSTLLDVDEFMPPQEKMDKTEKTPNKKGGGGPLIAPLPGVDVRGNITAKSVKYNKIPMNNVTITINVINDIADIVVKAGFAGGVIAENFHADLQNVNAINYNNKLTIKDVEVNDVMANLGGFLKPTTALNRELINLPKSLRGKINMSSNFKGNGSNADEMVNTLRGDIDLKMVDGTITNSLIVNKLSGSAEKFLKLKDKDIRFKDLSTVVHIAEKKVVIDNLKLLSDAGDWNVKGNVGFDAQLDINISNRLPKDVSGQLLNVQNSGKNMIKGLLRGTQLAHATNLIDNNDIGIPSDQDGRVTLLFALSGTAKDPKTTFSGFGKGTNTSQKQQRISPKTQIMNTINQKVDQTKAEAQKRLDEERKKAEVQMQQKTAEQKQVILEKKDNAEEQLKKAAKDKLKRLF